MARISINDRTLVEEFYSKETFDQDAAENGRGKATIIRGVKILSAPDMEGGVELVRASQHVGESSPDQDSIFVAAHRAGTAKADEGNAYSASVEPTAENADEGDEYRQFIDRLLQTAKDAQFQRPIGKGEERLVGFHGG
jgi:hypothetical protein